MMGICGLSERERVNILLYVRQYVHTYYNITVSTVSVDFQDKAEISEYKMMDNQN